MRNVFIILFVSFTAIIQAQTLIKEENDTTITTEYNDGRLWAFKKQSDIVVGVTNYIYKDEYGKNYQIQIMIHNTSNEAFVFFPDYIYATILGKDAMKKDMKVYTYELYMKKIKRQQDWAMALTSFSAGFNAGSAGYQTTYSTSYAPGKVPYTQVNTTYNHAAASAANMAAQTQIMTLGEIMKKNKQIISQGYLKRTTIRPNETIVGYINIKHSKGQQMTVNIPVRGKVFSFDWNISKKKQ